MLRNWDNKHHFAIKSNILFIFPPDRCIIAQFIGFKIKSYFILPFLLNLTENDMPCHVYNNKSLRPLKPNTECYRTCFMYNGCKLWNSLPVSITVATSTSVFNKRLQLFLFHEQIL